MEYQLWFLHEAIAASAALSTADRLGVLARIDAGPVNLTDLARECGIGERGAHVLLSALAGLGLVESSGEGLYRASVPGISGLATLRAFWDRLDEAVRDDHAAAAGDIPGDAEAFYLEVEGMLGALFSTAAERAADRLAGPGLRILDVSAGTASWSLAIAARHPDCVVTMVDLPAVLPAIREAVDEAGMGAQFTYLTGDLLTVDLGSSAHDLAIAGNRCHLFDAAANRRLLGRLFHALCPGGDLAILDVLPNERLDGPRPVVLYALSLLLSTRHGRVYPFSTYMSWLRDAGCETIERHNLTATPPISLITARRPD